MPSPFSQKSTLLIMQNDVLGERVIGVLAENVALWQGVHPKPLPYTE